MSMTEPEAVEPMAVDPAALPDDMRAAWQRWQEALAYEAAHAPAAEPTP